MNDFENSTTTQIENLSLHELIEYELKAIESLTNVVDLSAEIRSFSLKENERSRSDFDRFRTKEV